MTMKPSPLAFENPEGVPAKVHTATHALQAAREFLTEWKCTSMELSIKIDGEKVSLYVHASQPMRVGWFKQEIPGFLEEENARHLGTSVAFQAVERMMPLK